MKKLLAFTGKMGSGKTTACDYLVSQGGYVKVNFKDALVEEMKERLPDALEAIRMHQNTMSVNFDDGTHWTVDRLFRDKPQIMRALMQNYGTEVRRRDDPDYWTKRYKQRVQDFLEEGLNVVTDDCRFLNEAQTVKSLGGQIIKIERSDITHTGSHQSEMEMDSIVADTILHTEPGDLKGLYQQIDFMGKVEFHKEHDLGI